MKTYNFKEVQKIAKDNGFKFAALEDNYGSRQISFNGANTNIDAKLNEIKRRFDSDITADGVYYICFATTIRDKSKPQKFALLKGNYNNGESKGQNVIQLVKSEQVLSWESALKYMQEIQELKTTNTQLVEANKYLQARIDELEKDLDELDKTDLADEKPNAIKTFLSDGMPPLLSALDRYFDLEEKKINAGLVSKKQSPQQNQNARQIIKVGSEQHLKLIKKLYDEQNEEALNVQLDKLQNFNPKLYKEVIVQLNIEEEDEQPS